MKTTLNEDSQATLLICSNLAFSRNLDEKLKPYSLGEWNRLTGFLRNSQLKSPKALFFISDDEWHQLNINQDEIERLKRLLDKGGQLGLELERLSSQGIYITTRAEDNYPTLLKSRLKQKCPIFLYYAGSTKLFGTQGVAIVGSRDIDDSGIAFAQRFSEKATLEGMTIVSGGARGADSIGQNTAIKHDGTVISVLADSLEAKIRNKFNREAIMKNQLVMVSAVHPKARFNVGSAMSRNKYIYALAQAAVVISSDYKKGGTWAGAEENLKEKWVPLFIRRDEKMPKGNSELLKMGGYPIGMNQLEDNSGSLVDFLKKITVIDKKEQHEELPLFTNNNSSTIQTACVMETILSIGENEDVVICEQKAEEMSAEQGTSNLELLGNEEEIVLGRQTAYDILLPYLLKRMQEPKTVEELIVLFDVGKVQMQNWIRKMKEDSHIKQLNKPIRYVKI